MSITIQSPRTALRPESAVLGPRRVDFAEDLTCAVDWKNEGAPFDQFVTVNIDDYEAIPQFGTCELSTMDGEHAYLVKFKLADVNLAKGDAVYEISEI